MHTALPLSGPRVHLRHWRDEDLPVFAALNADPQVMAHFPAPLSRSDSDALAARLRRPTGRDVLATAGAIYAESFGTPEGRLPATAELVFLTGWAPHDSQQQPLRPGSAKARLADALGVPESPLPEDG